jgi:predicted nucleic acid-binding protein
VKAFLDTSVLIAVFQESHVHHQSSFDLFVSLKKPTASCAAHSLAEFYAVATGLPGRLRVRGEHALLFIENILERLTVVSLTPEEYAAALRAYSGMGITGGTIYDALIAQCALKAGAETLYTWNARQWKQLGLAIADRLRTPH